MAMHVEKRKSGGRGGHVKYYLAHSFRRNGRVKKIRVYLGADLTKAEIAEHRRHAEAVLRERIASAEHISDPYVTALSSSEVKELEALEARGKIEVFHLSELDWRRFTEAFTFDTNAIEGSSVNEKEVVEVLERQEWPEQRSKEEIAETYGVAEAVAYIRRTKEHVSIGLIKKLHEIVFKNSKSFTGGFREKGVEVVVQDDLGNVIHRGASSLEVHSLLKELVSWYAENEKKYSPLVLAAVVHNQFENIHPFRDGNGRVGRLLLNNILLKHGLPPLNIELRNRREYYEALQAYEKRGDLRPTIVLMLKEYRALKKMLRK